MTPSPKRTHHEFVGTSFRQNPGAPELFSFVGSADELRRICGVARKSENLLSNYQRALDEERVKRDITPFFRIPENCSPTAIVISLHETPLAKIAFEELDDQEGDLAIRQKKLTLDIIDPGSLTDAEIIEHAKKFLDQRLVGEININEGEDKDEELEEDEKIMDAEDIADDENEEEDNGDVEIGQSMLVDIRNRLNEDEDLPKDMMDTLREMLLPALILDGQHRLYGAAGVEENIPMLICSLVEPDWKEQVFQFTVINDKAKGIPRPFITSLAGMSLTSKELDEIRTRLAQAGVQLWEVEVMQKLGYDPSSPFYNLIEFKVTGSGSSGLGYQTMKRVGKAWYDPKHQGLINLMRMLYVGKGGARKNRKWLKSSWQSNVDWYVFLSMFWKKLKVKLGSDDLWESKSSLMIAVVLEQLQEVFLTYLDSVSALTIDRIDVEDDGSRSKKVREEMDEIIDTFLANFEAKHFAKEWAIKSLGHKDGKLQLQDYFDKIQKGVLVNRHPLVAIARV
jgi:hypothetical protein